MIRMDSMDGAKVFVGDTSGPPQYTAVFEVTDRSQEDAPAGGYLYVSNRDDLRILKHLEIYRDPALEVDEGDVRIFWSSDGSKCGVAIWGRMRGIIDVANSREISTLLESRESPAITDPEWLNGFNGYLDETGFMGSRVRYWRNVAQRCKPELRAESELPPLDTNFILYEKGPEQQFCVFEDDHDTGYLYLYDASKQQILQHLHTYDHSRRLEVTRQDVDVAWSEDYAKCGVIIWSKMRGIIDRTKHQEGRVKLEHRDSPGIADKEWLKGFEYIRESVTRH